MIELIYGIVYAILIIAGSVLILKTLRFKRTKSGLELKNVRPSTPLEKKIGLILFISGCLMLTIFWILILLGENNPNYFFYAYFGGLLAIIGGSAYFEIVYFGHIGWSWGIFPRKISYRELDLMYLMLTILLLLFVAILVLT
ncbi:MAG: hypothetical protein QXX38_02640 [Candidatus Aenigmatarchaeota archaeon]